MKTRYLILKLILLLFVSDPAFGAQIDPAYNFNTIETKHFIIHGHQGLEETMQRAAVIAEEAHSNLTERFGWAPLDKTHIVLVDGYDSANGWATVLPYNLIYVFVVPPTPNSSIGEYDDWLRIVITHEYTHIVTMDVSRGFWEGTRKIFGKPIPGSDLLSFLLFLSTAPPNNFLPGWWIEGMAVWSETEHSQSGRGRGTYFDTFYRMAVYDDNIPTIDKINGDDPHWPNGSMPYIMGLAMTRFISAKYGPGSLAALSNRHAGIYPYVFNQVPKTTFGRDYIGLYKDMILQMKDEQGEKIKLIKSALLTEFQLIEMKEEGVSNPKISRDGRWLAMMVSDPGKHSVISVFNAVSYAKEFDVRVAYSDGKISWSPEGDFIYFTQTDFKDGYNLYQDLYSYEIKSKEIRQITEKLRIKEPDVSPDGRTIVAVSTKSTEQELVLLEADGHRATLKKVLLKSKNRLSMPRWSADGSKIAYSVKNDSVGSSLYIMDVNSADVRKVVDDTSQNDFVVWSPDGSYLLFSSDVSGVFNIYAYRLKDGMTLRATNVIGAAVQAEVSPDSKTLYFTNYYSRGFKIAKMPYAPDSFSVDPAPSITHLWPDFIVANASDITNAAALSAKHDEPVRYSALKGLRPRFWLPSLSSDNKGLMLGAFTAAADPLGYHSYAVSAWQSSRGNVYYDARYIFDRYYPTFTFRGYNLPIAYSNYLGGGDALYERQTAVSAEVEFPLKRVEKNASLVLGFHHKEQRHIEGMRILFEGNRDALVAGLVFRNALKYPLSVSPEEGRTLSLIYKNYSKAIGSDLDSREYIGAYREYIGWSGHNVFTYSLKAGASNGSRIPQDAFQLGGLPTENEDFPVRGFPSRFASGRYIATSSIEYRTPIKYILRGINTKPFFFDRAHLCAFTDLGLAWRETKNITARDIHAGAGFEVRLDIVLGYKLSITPAIGYAHGFPKDGEDRVYFTIVMEN